MQHAILQSALALALLLGLSSHGSAQQAKASAADGKRHFVVCAACHSIDGSAKVTGPTLKGVVGRKAASVAAYKNYSKALQASAIVWSLSELDAYLKAPSQKVKGTTMMVALTDDSKRKAVLAYLESLK